MDPNQLEAAMNSLPPSTVENMLNPTAEVVGQSAGGIARTVLYPLLKLNIYSKAKLEQYETNVKNKINQIPVENRDPSKMPQVLQLIDDSKYRIGEDDIRKLFENLIANTVDSRMNQGISPRYATVISQFGHKDAVLLDMLNNFHSIYHTPNIPTAEVVFVNPTNQSTNRLPTTFLITDKNQFNNSFQKELDNLSSFGIITMHDDRWLSSDSALEMYDSFKNSDIFRILSRKCPENFNPDISKGMIILTSFGLSFVNVTH